MCYWSLDLLFKAELNLESGNQKKIQYDYTVAILKLVALKIYRRLHIAKNKTYMEFEIQIRKKTSVIPRKPCHLFLKSKGRIWLRGGHFESAITKTW